MFFKLFIVNNFKKYFIFIVFFQILDGGFKNDLKEFNERMASFDPHAVKPQIQHKLEITIAGKDMSVENKFLSSLASDISTFAFTTNSIKKTETVYEEKYDKDNQKKNILKEQNQDLINEIIINESQNTNEATALQKNIPEKKDISKNVIDSLLKQPTVS